MKKTGLIFSAVLFSFFLVLSSSAFADKGSHPDAAGHGSTEQQYEEGSGSSAVESSMDKAEEYKSAHEGEEEGSFSYKKHRKEMKDKEKAMQEGMPMPAGTSGKMEEGSGKK